MANLYVPNILELVRPQHAEARVIHGLIGNLGQLFLNFDSPIATPKDAEKVRVWDFEAQEHQVFDWNTGEWVTLNDEFFNSIPNTYTFAPQPQNVEMEIDYFVRGCGLLKHSFIWSTNEIPRENFEKIASSANYAYCGRYTVTPWFPRIYNLGRMEYGMYVMDDDDWQKIYG